MQTLPQRQNQFRWEPLIGLRNGQKRLFEYISTVRKRQYSIQLPTGYGKSWCACIAYVVLRDLMEVDRLLIVVPNDQQRSQYIEGLIEDLSTLSIGYSGIEKCDNQASWVIRKSHRNESEIFVAGVQSIAACPGYYADLMAKNKWLVVADEFHHYAEGNTWGAAVKSLPYQVIMGMSATPTRGDRKPTIFGDLSFDVDVSIDEAYQEGAIRRVEARIGDYSISWSSIDSPDPHSCLMSELADEWGFNGSNIDMSEYELRKEVRYYDKYISEIFLQVLETWNEYESQFPGQNQILVFAMTCRHAEMITKIINECAFPGFPQPFADWIGVGEGLNGNKTSKENDRVLNLFQQNKLPCLVQVNKAGEGFNNKRCSIGLFLDLVGDCPNKRQHIGRFMRVNPAAPGQSSVIFISEDSPAKALLENLEESFNAVDSDGIGEGDKSGSSSKQDRQLVIPDIRIIDTEFESERVVYPFGSPEAAMRKYIEESPQLVKDAYALLSEEQALEVFKRGCEPWLREKYRKDHPPLTSEQQRKQASDQVHRNTGALVSLVLRVRYGKSFPKSTRGDLFKLINGKWAREFGRHKEMTREDLEQKNKWLQSLATSIQECGEVPSWLSL